MDLSIWYPPENQDESSNPTNSRECNLYFDPRLDVIEEDALNEKSCLQVLKILMNKADSEIVELEDDIAMLQRQLACEDNLCVAELDKKIVNLDCMLRALKNENQQTAEPGVGSSNLPEGLNEMEATGDHSSNDIKGVKFKDGCTFQVDNIVLASPVQPAETTLKDRHASEQEAGKEYSSKPTRKGAVQINDPFGLKGQEVVHTETDCTIEDTRPRLLSSKRNDRSKPRKKKRGGADYGDKTIEATQQQLDGANKAGGFADVNTASQSHSRKRSGARVIRENKDQKDYRNRLVKPHGRTSQKPLVTTSSPGIADIDNMSLVQLKALANRNNIYGVSISRKADLKQLLRSKLQAKDWS